MLAKLQKPLQWIRSNPEQTTASSQDLVTKNIYVLPTKQGVLFAILLAIMLVGSINYSNSLGLMLTFLLASLNAVSIFHTHKNLYRLRVSVNHIGDVFCGNLASIPVILENNSANPRFAIKVAFPGATSSLVNITANSYSQITIPQKTLQRGWQPIEPFTVSSTFPLGLFVAWSRIHLDTRILVYPEPAQATPFAQHPTYTPKHSGDKGRGSDDFAGFRNYNRGDNLGHIHWKAVARNQGLYIKQFGGDRSDELWLDWNTLEHLNREQKLSLLTRWIIDAEQKGMGYGLILPACHIEPSHGEAHKTRCLTALALFR